MITGSLTDKLLWCMPSLLACAHYSHKRRSPRFAHNAQRWEGLLSRPRGCPDNVDSAHRARKCEWATPPPQSQPRSGHDNCELRCGRTIPCLPCLRGSGRSAAHAHRTTDCVADAFCGVLEQHVTGSGMVQMNSIRDGSGKIT